MPRYVLTDLAKADIREIVGYLRAQSPQAARKVRIELRAAMQRLAEFPLIGHLREDLAPVPLRFWGVYSFLIVYRPDSTPLQVLRVLHGAQNLASILKTNH